jgi:formylglycine-generating enzyme required for sulfatase activity
LRAPTPLQLAARALRRHRVAVGLGAALLAASGVGAAIAAGRAPKSVLAMRAPGLHGAEVWIAAVEPTRWEIGRYARLGVAPLQARVGLGHYRVVVRRDGAFVELTQRADVAEQEYEVGATARLLAAASTAGMVLVPACEFTFGHGDQPHLPSTAQRRVRLAAFWIDEAEVSNRDYRAFLLATGHKKPAMWPADWKENWNAAWDDLPAAGVLHASARAYAAWAGKRLPTEQEWERAARGTDGWLLPWRADFDADDVRRRCNVERPFSNEAAWPPRFANYLAVAQPVRSGAGRSAAGLFHCVGNVGEWVDNAHSVRDGDVERVSFEVRLRGADSHDDPPKWRLPMAFWVAPETNLQTYGFRCARSAADPTTTNPK